MAIVDKLNELITQRNNLADNLNTMGVSAIQSETLTTLVPKVLEIQTGGGSEITKGLIINEVDGDGYPTDVSIVGITSIPDYYFFYCFYNNCIFSKVGSKLHLPDSLISIGANAFSNCSNLALTSLPDNLISISSNAFYNCSKLALTSLPDNLNSIGESAFQSCKNLALTELPNNLTSINKYVFSDCTNLALNKLPDKLISINSSAFRNCTNLALTELPNTLVSIGNDAFSNCSKLALTSLPDKITSIASYVFYKCTSLTEITCKGKVTSISSNAFNSTGLIKFVLPNITSVPSLANKNAFGSTPIELKNSNFGFIYVPDNLVASFKTATNWSTYATQIKPISELEG